MGLHMCMHACVMVPAHKQLTNPSASPQSVTGSEPVLSSSAAQGPQPQPQPQPQPPRLYAANKGTA
mgnify:CR=1 FL=1